MDSTDLDATKIPGSAPLEFKRNALEICKNWLWTGNGIEFYCIEIVRRLQLKSIWLDEDRDVPGRRMGKLVLAIVVTEGKYLIYREGVLNAEMLLLVRYVRSVWSHA